MKRPMAFLRNMAPGRVLIGACAKVVSAATRLGRGTPVVPERRQAPRVGGHRVIANVAGRLTALHDISEGGARITLAAPPPGGALGETIVITLYPCNGNRVNVNASIRLAARVLDADAGAIRVSFDDAPAALTRLVADATGA